MLIIFFSFILLIFLTYLINFIFYYFQSKKNGFYFENNRKLIKKLYCFWLKSQSQSWQNFFSLFTLQIFSSKTHLHKGPSCHICEIWKWRKKSLTLEKRVYTKIVTFKKILQKNLIKKFFLFEIFLTSSFHNPFSFNIYISSLA